jgi:hypothetical protein
VAPTIEGCEKPGTDPASKYATRDRISPKGDSL